ncbi:MAG: ParB N-terminal domain-containing protein [Gammaproteobacteria bacterium]
MLLPVLTKSYPFSLITSQGLGVSYASNAELSSLVAAHAVGASGVHGAINAVKGNVCVQDRSFALQDQGETLNVGYVYNSQIDEWRFAAVAQLHMPVTPGQKEIVVQEVDGHLTTYTYNELTNSYHAPSHDDGTPTISFDVSSSTWVWSHPKTHSSLHFDSQGRGIAQYDAFGRVTHFKYDDKNQLNEIIFPSNLSYQLKSDNDKQHLIRIDDDQQTILHTYHLDDKKRLLKSITADGLASDYQYVDAELRHIQSSDGTSWHFDFDANKKISSISIGDEAPQVYTFDIAEQEACIKDSCNNKLNLKSDLQGKLLAITKSNCQVDLEYSSLGHLYKITYQDQTSETFEHEKLSGLLTKHTARDGSVSEWHYDLAANGQLLLTKQSTANAEINYIYETNTNATHPLLQFQISPEGRVTEFLHNEFGMLSGIRHYLNETFSIKELTLDDIHVWKDKHIQQTALTTFQYDAYGRVETKQTYAHINEQGEGIVDAEVQETTFKWDALNQLTKQVLSGNVQRFEHDGWQRLLKQTLGAESTLAITTSHDYKKESEVITHPDAHVEKFIHNDKGDIKKTVEKSEETDISYLANGDHYKVRLSDGTSHYELTDESNHAHYQISSLGLVSEKKYDPNTRCTTNIQYAKAITIQDPLTLTDLQEHLSKISSPKDRITRDISDKNGKPKYAIDALNYITEYRYNEFGLEVAKIQYSAALSDQELSNLVSGLDLSRDPDRQNARIHITHYDKDQLKVAEQDAAGYFTYFKHDAASRLIEKSAALKPDMVIAWQSPNIIPQELAKHRYVYNNLDQIISEVDVEGYVTAYSYYPNGKKSSSIRYETPIKLDPNAKQLTQPTVQISKNDRHINFEYDALDRLSKTSGPNYQVTTFTYDAMGRQVATYQQDSRVGIAATSDQVRGHEQSYDELGHLIAEINPLVAEELKKLDRNPSITAEDKKIKRRELIAKHSDQYIYMHGLKVKAIDALGNQSLFYYDADHRPIIKIDNHGSIIETSYNAFGEVEQERHYLNQIPAAILAGLTGGLVTKAVSHLLSQLHSSEKDSQTQFIYDSRGHLEAKQTSDLGASTYQYNAFGECEQETQPSVFDEPLIIIHEYNVKGLETATQTKHKPTGVYATVKREYEHYLGKQTTMTNEEGIVEHYNHSASGQLLSISKEVGLNQAIVTLEKTYDAYDRVLTETDANGHVTTYEYNDQALTVTIIHPDLTQTLITKNIFGETVSIQDPLGHVELFDHSAAGQIIQHKTEASGVTQTKHDYLGRVVKETHADGAKTAFHYQGLHLIEQVIKADNLKLVTGFETDGQGRQKAVIDPTGVRTEKEYNRAGQLIQSVLDPKGLAITEERSYYANGLLKQIQKGNSQEPNQYQEKMIYDAQGQLVEQVIDPDGLSIKHKKEYDQAHRLIKEYTPAGHYKKYHYNALNQRQFSVEQIDDKYARLLEWSYDAAGNITSTRVYTTRLDQSVAYHVDMDALLSHDKTVDDAIQYFVFDKNHHERYKLNVFFDPHTRTQHAYVEEIVRDAAGHPILTIQHNTPVPYSGSADLSLKAISQLVDVQSDKNQFTRRVFDAAGRERFSIDHQGKIEESRYDAVGQVIAKITYGQRYPAAMNLLKIDASQLADLTAGFIYRPERDKGEWFIYDGAGRCTHEINPMGGVVRHVFDANGKIAKKVYFHSKTRQLSDNYADMVSDISAWEVKEGTDAVINMAYDAAGRLKTSTDALGNQESFTYDALGNQLSHTNREQHTWTYKYNRANQCTRKISPETTITETDLKDGKLVASTKRTAVVKEIEVDANGNQVTVTSAHQLKDQRQFKARFNGLNQLVGTTLENVEIDDPTQSAHLTNRAVKKVTIETNRYYNTRGQKIAESDEADRYCYYVYDALGRLTHEINRKGAIKAHTYDAFSRLIKTINYAKIPNINWINYRESGIPLYVMHDSCVAGPEDRTTVFEHADTLVEDHAEVQQSQDAVPCYSDGQFSMSKPLTTERHNVFGQVRCIAQTIRPGVTADTYQWHDHSGHLVLEVSPDLYVTWYELDAFGELKARHEFANALAAKPNINATISELLATVKRSAEKDRVYHFRHDLAGNLLEERQKDIAIHENIKQPDGSYQMQPVVADSVKSYSYDRLQQKTVEDNNGRKTQFVRNELGHVIGEVAPTRTPEGQVTPVTPYIEHGIDAHGKRVKTRRCAVSTDSTKKVVPPAHADDQETLTQFDQCGLPAFKQSAINRLQAFTYTAGRQVTRECHPQVVWNSANDPVIVLDHTTTDYDDEDKLTGRRTYRNNVLEKAEEQRYNAFNEIEALGGGDQKWPVYLKRDASGRIWSTNRDGVKKILLNDLAGRQTMSITSPVQDLSVYDLGIIPAILVSPVDGFTRQETIYDLSGRFVAHKAPSWFRTRPVFPTSQEIHDRWQVRATVDAKGNKTEHESNQLSFETATILPDDDIVNAKMQKIKASLISKHGCNIHGEEIATCDAKGHTTVHLRDEVGQVYVTVLGDGNFTFKERHNIFGAIDQRTHHNGGITSYLRNKLNLCIEITHPDQFKQAFGYDLQGQRNLVMDRYGYTYRINHNTQGVIIGRYNPLGGLTSIIPDRNGKALSVSQPNGTAVSTVRDYFSFPQFITDAGGNVEELKYDSANEPIRRFTIKLTGSHGVECIPNASVTSFTQVPGRGFDMIYIRRDGLLYELHDTPNDRHYFYNYNANGLIQSYVITNNADRVLYSVVTEYNAHNLPIKHTCTGLKADGNAYLYVQTIDYDAVDNKCVITHTMTTTAQDGPHTVTTQSYNDFNAADRIVVADGVFTPAGIDIIQGKGCRFGYAGPLRNVEVSSTAWGWISTGIRYDTNAQACYTENARLSVRMYFTPGPDRLITHKDEFYANKDATWSEVKTDGLNRQWSSITKENGHEKATTEFSYLPFDMVPNIQIFRYVSDKSEITTDTFKLSVATFQEKLPHMANGHREFQGHVGPDAQGYDMYSSHGHLSTKRHAGDERTGERDAHRVYDTTESGMVLSTHKLAEVPYWINIPTMPPIERHVPVQDSHYFIHTPNQELLAAIREYRGPKTLHPGFKGMVYPKEIKMLGKTERTPADANKVNPDDLGNPAMPSLPAFGVHIVQEGQSIASIAKQYFGNGRDAADAISIANDLLVHQPLAAGSVLILPPYIQNTLKGEDSYPYHQFMSVIQGSLLPYLTSPTIPPPKSKSHHQWWKDVVKIIVVAIALACLPYLVGPLMGVLGVVGGGLGEALIVGVSAGLLDAAAQGVAIATGIQEHFSMSESFEMAATAGLSKGFHVGGYQAGQSLAQQAKVVVKTGMVAVSVQLTEMAMGLRKQFDVQAVMTQMTALAIGGKIDEALGANTHQSVAYRNTMTGRVMNAASAGAKSIASDYLGMKLHHVPVNVESLAGQALGSMANDGLQSAGDDGLDHGVGKKQDYHATRDHAKTQHHELKSFASSSLSSHGSKVGNAEQHQSTHSTAKIKTQLVKKGRLMEALDVAMQVDAGMHDSVIKVAKGAIGTLAHLPEIVQSSALQSIDTWKVMHGLDRHGESKARVFATASASKKAIDDYRYNKGKALIEGTIRQKSEAVSGAILDATMVVAPLRGFNRGAPLSIFRSSNLGKAILSKAETLAKGLSSIKKAKSSSSVSVNSLVRTEALSGRSSSKRVAEIASDMRASGYNGPPIDVVVDEHGSMYIIDGHHRAAAAKATNTPVKINVVTDIANHHTNYKAIEEIIHDSLFVGRDKLRSMR